MKTIKYFLLSACFFLSIGFTKANCETAFSIGYDVAINNHMVMLESCFDPAGIMANWASADIFGAFNDMLMGMACIGSAGAIFNNTVNYLLFAYDCCHGNC